MNNSVDIDAYATKNKMRRDQVLRILVSEAFLRRAAVVAGPFVLKGSFVTRQYLPDPGRRIPVDLDWVGKDEFDAEVLTAWMIAVTNAPLDDGVRFRCFSENAFWRGVDYAMDDDFPTINTDLLAWVGDEKYEMLGTDVSFGLNLDPAPVPLCYRPIHGASFVLPATCALELQIAWKLHQSLVRPRFKDLVDLTWLLQHNRIDAQVVMQALGDECRRDGTPIQRFDWLLDRAIGKHPSFAEQISYRSEPLTIEQRWTAWIEGGDKPGYARELLAKSVVRDVAALPKSAKSLLKGLSIGLAEAGFEHIAPQIAGSGKWWRRLREFGSSQ